MSPRRRLAFALTFALALCGAPLRAEEAPAGPPPEGFFPPPAPAPTHGQGTRPGRQARGTAESANRAIDTGPDGTTFVVPCPRCRGAKRCLRPLSAAERVSLQRQARNAYEREQRARRRVPVGAGFMDRAAAEALEPVARAALAARYPKPCRTCQGLGIENCRKCKGQGKIEKIERVEDEEGETQIKPYTLPCAECGGSGSQPCRRCEGSGLAKICSRCDGAGVTDVPAARDRPAYTTLCRSCKGDGRR